MNRSFSLDLVGTWTVICELMDPLFPTKYPKTSPYDANLKREVITRPAGHTDHEGMQCCPPSPMNAVPEHCLVYTKMFGVLLVTFWCVLITPKLHQILGHILVYTKLTPNYIKSLVTYFIANPLGYLVAFWCTPKETKSTLNISTYKQLSSDCDL